MLLLLLQSLKISAPFFLSLFVYYFYNPQIGFNRDTRIMLKRRRRVRDIEDAVKAAATKPDYDFICEYLARYDTDDALFRDTYRSLTAF